MTTSTASPPPPAAGSRRPPPPWSAAIAIRDHGREFSTLPRAADLIGQPSDVALDEVVLPEPLAALADRDPWPIPTLDDREGYYIDRDLDYWKTGLLDYHLVRARAASHGERLAPGDRVLDLGCASGRALRHFACQFPADAGAPLDLWGVDINAAHIRWLHEHIDAPFRAFQCSALPRLPLEDRSVRLVYAFSVFSHVDEFEHAWLAEIRRILAPGGLAYVSFQSEDSWENAKRHESLRAALLRTRDVRTGSPVTDETLARPLPAERVALTCSSREAVYSKQIFHSASYVERIWGRFLTPLEIREAGHAGHQAVALMQKER